MKFLTAIILLAGLGAAAPAWAQRSGAGPAGSDACETEANRLYSSMRNLEERMRVKRDYIRQCRATARGGRR